jgi:hypothetical protein
MRCPSAARSLLAWVVLWFLFTANFARAQQDVAPTESPVPHTLVECERNQCRADGSGGALWTFHGQEGTGRWQDGALASLTVKRYGPSGVAIVRIDPPGSTTPGMRAVYNGTIRGNRIEGSVVRTWPGHWSRPVAGTWYAIVGGGNAAAASSNPKSAPPAQPIPAKPPTPATTPNPPAVAGGHASSGDKSTAASGDESCDGGAGHTVTSEESVSRGEQAFGKNHTREAVCWWKIGAMQGNARAEFYYGLSFEYSWAGKFDRPESMRWVTRAAKDGEVRARVYVVCNSPGAISGMKQLFRDSDKDPNVKTGDMLSALFGLETHEDNYEVTDTKAVDLVSDHQFGCTVLFSARREVTTTPDENGERHDVVPAAVGSMAPIKQTFTFARSGDQQYTLTMPYIGDRDGVKFALLQKYAVTIAAPTW